MIPIPPSTHSQQGRSIIGFLFGLIFAAAGFGFITFLALPDLTDWQQMKSWQPVKMTITSTRLESHSGDSTTYEAHATYRYHFNNQPFNGNRVGISSGADNIGSWQQQTYQRLRDAEQRGYTVNGWVNPQQPGESVIYREMRWGLMALKGLLGGIFALIGSIVAIASLSGSKAKTKQSTTTPWLGNPKWQSNPIRSSAVSQLKGIWLFAVLWNAISMPAPFLAFDEFMAGDYAVAFVLLFPIVGAGFLYFAIKKSLEWYRFGPTPLTLSPMPGSLGGKVAGHIDINLPYSESRGIEITLKCIHTYTSGSGKNRTTHNDTLWESTQSATIAPGMNGTRLQFNFITPDNLPESSNKTSGNRHRWELSAKGEMRGPDLDRSFDIPVYDTGEASSDKVRTADQAALHVDDESAAVELDSNKVVITPRVDGTNLFYPVMRDLGFAIGMMIFGTLFAAPVLLINHFTGGDVPITFLIIFVFIGGLLLLSGLYMVTNSLEVHAGRTAITTTRRILGFPLRTTITTEEIVGFEQKVAMSSSSGSKRKVRIKIEAITRGGKKQTLGDTLPNAKTAKHLIEIIEHATHFKGGDLPASDSFKYRKQQISESSKRKFRYAANIIAFIIFVFILWDFFGDIIPPLLFR